MTHRKYFNQRAGIADSRNSLGGHALLPFGVPFPTCRLCDRPLLLFLQFDLPRGLDLPFPGGSRLLLFMCPEHNEIPSFEQKSQLVGEYWNTAYGNWFALLTEPTEEYVAQGPELIEHVSLSPDDGPMDHGYKIALSGAPEWLQDPERFVCSCGTEMQFFCQISDSYKFKKLPNAPEQPDSPYSDGYVLFLGNETYIFACPNQCNPRAVWITVQN